MYRITETHLPKKQKTNEKTEDDTFIAFESEITKEIESQIEKMAQNNLRIETFPGYRIQIYSGASRKEASNLVDLLAQVPDITDPVYLHYEQPYFKVKIGDYTSRIKAHEVYTGIKETYPYAIVIRDAVSFNIADYLYPGAASKPETTHQAPTD